MADAPAFTGWTPPAYTVDADGKVVGAALPPEPHNWGRWGPLDEIGTANFITPEVTARAAALIRTGRVVSCAAPLDTTGPDYPGRAPVFHAFTYTGTDFVAGAPCSHRLGGFHGYHGTDDVIFMPLQASTQWDGLAHAGTEHTLYNGFWIGMVDANSGARRCSIHRLAGRMAGRGVLLDLPRHLGVERLQPGFAIPPDLLDACAGREGVELRSGDMLVVRTGHVPWWYRLEDKREFWAHGAPGLSRDCVPWLHAREAAAVALDNIAVEVEPFEPGADMPFPLHRRLIRDLGLTLGEIWWLEELAEACATEGRWEFFLTAPPMNVTNASGSPINPLAIF